MKHNTHFKMIATTSALVLSAVLLVACGPHQIVDTHEPCESCHEDPAFNKDELTFDVGYPQGAREIGAEVAVHTSAPEVVVCRPTFISDDGSKFVPERYRTIKVQDGVANITLDEGCWALCIDKGDSAEGVIVLSSGIKESVADIEL